MAYNFKKKTCDVCGEREPKYISNSLNYADKCLQGFRLGFNGSVLCHKEKELKEIFILIDKRMKQPA